MTGHVIPEGVPEMPLERYLRRAWPLIPGRVLRDALKKKDVRVNGARRASTSSRRALFSSSRF